ncbi:hypothetical protein HMPREF3152_03370 [Actinomyces sp. HMSC06A08]|uniref:Uncharacterized protein n=1 Tax=Winkia neuii TaxID=33007 RepID=A0A2I1INF3_9ACTO|nr:hypothetical protein [Winkia neuii]OFJ71745.1 hypothetical protein HMPREF2851_06240 [Actinomyces sp. HMSC064C12]OFK01251.1 hypothetical protein HMPREF2835_10850 [Actinomyces sp. HMSC072A03]OFT55709.1 hypothetical protein HMPREF3152_03370 [Actinomyces sp. HMSC06A08]MDK8099110.1 hypothetical protein [Winkia neuii]PKY72657.1 hypothetical protein CYJ19_03155 [Winkia neuii]
MATVSYFDFALVDNTRFEFQVRGEGKDFCCYFDFGRPIVLTDKTLTATLAIISGRAFDRIEVGHPLPPDCVEFLRSFCRAEIVPSASAPNLAVPYVPQKSGNIGLSFSGGFDSLAAWKLLPAQNTTLISLDFGGRFSREAQFFTNFPVISVKTNLVAARFHTHTWAFMALGAILAAPTLGLQTLSFGTILEASSANMTFRGLGQIETGYPVFDFLGLTWYNPALGLTEIGTALISAKTHPELLSESLKSLAEPGTEKLYRKWVLLRLVERLTGQSLPVEEPRRPYPQHRVPFGSSFTSHMLSFYMRKHLGAEVADIFVSDVPAAVDEFVARADLTFFERYNSNFLHKVPPSYRPGLIKTLASFGILPYTEKDFLEYQRTLQLLKDAEAKLAGQ